MREFFSAFVMMAAMLGAASTVHAGGAEPFPLNSPLPFPWESIEGNWELKNAGLYSAYIFEIQNTCEGRVILRVRQFDVITGEVLSEGIGYKLTDSQEVRAAMKGKTGNHLLYVGAYLNKTVSPAVPANVLRIVPFDPEKEGKAWEILKFPRDLRPRIHNEDQQVSLTCVDDRE
jgi:hypothetical protein